MVVVVILLGAIAVAALLYCAWWLWRKASPPRADHLRVTATADSVHRGDDVEVRLEILDTAKAAAGVEVGIVCTEWYEVYSTQGPSRARDHRAHEQWQRADPSERLQTIRLQVPADAPFSYSGGRLKFEWQAVAREAQPGRFPPRVSVPLHVNP